MLSRVTFLPSLSSLWLSVPACCLPVYLPPFSSLAGVCVLFQYSCCLAEQHWSTESYLSQCHTFGELVCVRNMHCMLVVPDEEKFNMSYSLQAVYISVLVYHLMHPVVLPYSGLFPWGVNFHYFRGEPGHHKNFRPRIFRLCHLCACGIDSCTVHHEIVNHEIYLYKLQDVFHEIFNQQN